MLFPNPDTVTLFIVAINNLAAALNNTAMALEHTADAITIGNTNTMLINNDTAHAYFRRATDFFRKDVATLISSDSHDTIDIDQYITKIINAFYTIKNALNTVNNSVYTTAAVAIAVGADTAHKFEVARKEAKAGSDIAKASADKARAAAEAILALVHLDNANAITTDNAATPLPKTDKINLASQSFANLFNLSFFYLQQKINQNKQEKSEGETSRL